MSKHKYIAIGLIALLSIACEPKDVNTTSEPTIASAEVKQVTQPASFFINDGKIPTIAIDDENQKMYVAFFREQGERTQVFVAQKEVSDAEWKEPVQVSSEEDDASAHGQAPAQVVVGPEGNVYVVWTNSIPVEGRRFPASNLLFSKSVDGGQTFSPQKAINTDAGDVPAGHTFHDVAVGPDGTIYVSWLDSRERYRAMAKAALSMPIQQASMVGHSHTTVAHEPGTQVWVAHSNDHGESFSEGTVVARETCQCCRTSIMVQANGDVYVAWRHIFDENMRDMAIAHSTDGGNSFTKPVRIFADYWQLEGCPHSGPSLVVDSAGRFHAAWYTGEETKPGLYYSTAEDGHSFVEPTPLIKDVGVSQVHLAGHLSDRTWLAWEDKHAKGVQVGYVDQEGALTMLDFMLPANVLPALDAMASVWAVASQENGGIRVLEGAF